MKPRLLIAVPRLGYGGPDRVVFELSSGLLGYGWEVHIATADPKSPRLSELPPGVHQHVVRTSPARLDNRYPAWGLAMRVREVNPQVVLTTHLMNTAALFARPMWGSARWAMRPNSQMSNFLHQLDGRGLRHRFVPALLKLSYVLADVTIAQSTSMRDEIQHTARHARIEVIGNPAPSRPHQIQDFHRRDKVVLGVGRLSKEKGFDTLIQAFSRSRASASGYTLKILGEGPERNRLASLVSSCRIEGVAHLCGESKSVLEVMSRSSLLVSSSRFEGFANVIVEALSMGTPVVGTTGPGGAVDVLTDDRLGLLVPPDDPALMAQAIDGALSTQWDSSTIAESVQELWSLDRILEQYDQALRRLL